MVKRNTEVICRIFAAAWFVYLGLGMLAVQTSPAYAMTPSSEGTAFAGLRKAVDHYEAQGFLLLGKFEYAQWPATVISEKEADDEISFTLRSGTPHVYPGYVGYRLKVVILEDTSRNESVLVFRSKKQKGEPRQPAPAAAPLQKPAAAIAPAGEAELAALRIGITRIALQLSSQHRQGPKRRIAVLDFLDAQGKATSTGTIIAELLISELFRTEQYEIMERKLLSSLLKEHKLNMSGLVDLSTARRVGKLLGVDYIVTGTVINLGTVLNVNARTIGIETGAISATGSADLPQDAFQQLR